MLARRYTFGGLAVVIVLTVLGVIGCASGQSSPGSSATSVAGPTALTVVGGERTVTYSMAQLRQLPSFTGYAGMKSSVGVITAPQEYTGVPLRSLVEAVGGVGSAEGVTVLAKDGYGMTFSNGQVAGTGFTTFDPATSAERPPVDKLTLLIAYAHEGKPLSPDEGPLRLVLAENGPDVVVDGHWSVKLVDRIEVKRAMGEWSASIEGKTRSYHHACLVRLLRVARLPRLGVGRLSGPALGGHPSVARRGLGRRRLALTGRARSTASWRASDYTRRADRLHRRQGVLELTLRS